jgi:hypothetical protein
MAYQGITTTPIASADSLLVGAVKINSNFTEIYDGLKNGSGDITTEVTVASGTAFEKTYNKITPGSRLSAESDYERSVYYAVSDNPATLTPYEEVQLNAGDFFVHYINGSATGTPIIPEVRLKLPLNPEFGNKVSIQVGTGIKFQTVRVSGNTVPPATPNNPPSNILGFTPTQTGAVPTSDGIILDVPNTTYTFVYVGRPYQSDVNTLSGTLSETNDENIRGWVLV